jgi:hypothetical protein
MDMLPDNEPDQNRIEALLTDEERTLLTDPDVPADVKVEILQRLNSFEAADLADAGAEDVAK